MTVCVTNQSNQKVRQIYLNPNFKAITKHILVEVWHRGRIISHRIITESQVENSYLMANM